MSRLTDEERTLIVALGKLYDDYRKLPVYRESDVDAFFKAVLFAERIVMSRPAARAEGWAEGGSPVKSPRDVGTAVGTLKVIVDPGLKTQVDEMSQVLPKFGTAEKPQKARDAVEQPSDKLVAAQQAKAVLGDEFVILDFETTSKYPDKAQIVQIGILDSGGQPLLNEIICPHTPLKAPTFTGITPEQVKDAPTLQDVAGRLVTMLHGKHVVIYNADYDWNVLKYDFKRNRLDIAIVPSTLTCAMKMFAMYYGEINPRYGTYTYKSLSLAMETLGIAWDSLGGEAHDALTDCRATLAVLRGMADFADLPF